jgi:hypothetical protein
MSNDKNKQKNQILKWILKNIELKLGKSLKLVNWVMRTG